MEMKSLMSSEISQAQKDTDHIHLCESMTSLIDGDYPDLYTTQCKQGSKYHTMPYEHAQFLCSYISAKKIHLNLRNFKLIKGKSF